MAARNDNRAGNARRLVRSTFVPLTLLITLQGCSAARPECQHDPAFYLRGTVFDCQTYEEADASKGVRP
jgi:hypothetical protein